MLFNPSFKKIGFIEKSHGVEGLLKVSFEEKSISKEVDFLFLDMKEQKVPYQVEDFNHSNGLLKLKDVNDPDFILTLGSRGIFLPSENEDMDLEDSDYRGYRIKEPEGSIVGVIHQIQRIPMNPQLEVEYENQLILIPWNPHLLLSIDHSKKEMVYSIPDGLLEL